MNKEKELFKEGTEAFNSGRFYDAHEFWEELWLKYKLKDAKCIQGLIQLAVSYFHYYNGNLNGAISMGKKCLSKFELFEVVRGIDIIDLKLQVECLNEWYIKTGYILSKKDVYTIKIKVKYEAS